MSFIPGRQLECIYPSIHSFSKEIFIEHLLGAKNTKKVNAADAVMLEMPSLVREADL